MKKRNREKLHPPPQLKPMVLSEAAIQKLTNEAVAFIKAHRRRSRVNKRRATNTSIQKVAKARKLYYENPLD